MKDLILFCVSKRIFTIQEEKDEKNYFHCINVCFMRRNDVSVFSACGTDKALRHPKQIRRPPRKRHGGQWSSLEGKSLMIYCGAGMKEPFAEISDNFKEATGADVQVTYGNAAQIVSQITTTDQGDLFIAGAEGELDPLKEKNYVTDSKNL